MAIAAVTHASLGKASSILFANSILIMRIAPSYNIAITSFRQTALTPLPFRTLLCDCPPPLSR